MDSVTGSGVAGLRSSSPRRRGREGGRQIQRTHRGKRPLQQQKWRGGKRKLPKERKTADGMHRRLHSHEGPQGQ